MTGPTSYLSDKNFTGQIFYQHCVQVVQVKIRIKDQVILN